MSTNPGHQGGEAAMIGIEGIVTRNPVTLRESDTLGDALELMASQKIHHVPVVDDEHHVIGLVSHRDVLAAAHSSIGSEAEQSRARTVPLSSFMTRDVQTIHEEVSLLNAGIFLNKHRYGCLPVVKDGKLTGIITDSDFVSIAIALLDQEEASDSTG